MKKTLLAAASMAIGGLAQAADITVLATPRIKDAYDELAPQFEKSANHKVKTTWAGTVDVLKRIKAGEVFDAVILASDSLAGLVDTSKGVAGSSPDVPGSLVG